RLTTTITSWRRHIINRFLEALSPFFVTGAVAICTLLRACRVAKVRRIIENISIQIDIACFEANRIFTDEPSHMGIVPAGAVVIEAGVGIELTTGVGVARPLTAAVVAERVVGDVLDFVSIRVSQNSCAAEMIRREVKVSVFVRLAN